MVTVCSQEGIQRRGDTGQDAKLKRLREHEGKNPSQGKRMPRKEVKGIGKQEKEQKSGDQRPQRAPRTAAS